LIGTRHVKNTYLFLWFFTWSMVHSSCNFEVFKFSNLQNIMEEKPFQEPSTEEDGNVLLQKHLGSAKFKYLLWYTVVLTLTFSWLFLWQLGRTEFLSKADADSLLKSYTESPRTDTANSRKQLKMSLATADRLLASTKGDSGKSLVKVDSIPRKELNAGADGKAQHTPVAKEARDRTIQELMLSILGLMLVSGVLGACLGNLRGFYYHGLYFGYFPKVKSIPYYVRPLIGALTGLFVFFLATFLNSATSYNSEIPKWVTITGAIPSLAIAFLAGFACLELMSRLKQVAESLFGYKPFSPPISGENGSTKVTQIDPDVFRTVSAPLIAPTERALREKASVARNQCNNPLSSLTDVYVVESPDENVTLTVSGVVGQIATSRVSLNNRVIAPSAKDEFSIVLGKASDLIGASLRVTTLILSSSDIPVGMQVSINNDDYSYLCMKPENGRFTFATDITFFN
jgi:hypothetical protein